MELVERQRRQLERARPAGPLVRAHRKPRERRALDVCETAARDDEHVEVAAARVPAAERERAVEVDADEVAADQAAQRLGELGGLLRDHRGESQFARTYCSRNPARTTFR